MNVDCLLEVEHLERCGSSVMTSSHLNGNKLRLREFFCTAVLLRTVSDAGAGSDTINKKAAVESSHSGL